METTLLIYANNSEQEKIPALKNEIVDYLGLRLVSSEMIGFPSIGIYGIEFFIPKLLKSIKNGKRKLIPL